MEKVYFNPGEIVRVKHELPNKPIMVVEEVHKVDMKFMSSDTVNSEKGNRLLGIECYWFTEQGVLQRKKFNSKDLEHV